VQVAAAGGIIDVVTGKLLTGQLVHFAQRPASSSTWTYELNVSEGSGDVAYREFTLGSSLYVHDSFAGSTGVMGSVGPTAYIPLAPNFEALYIGHLKSGGTEKISGTVFPHLTGQRIYLQRRFGGAWHAYRSMLLSSRSGFGFAFPLTTGTYTFRL